MGCGNTKEATTANLAPTKPHAEEPHRKEQPDHPVEEKKAEEKSSDNQPKDHKQEEKIVHPDKKVDIFR